ncbi:MAG: hypothetical protein HEQ27_02905 [Dolichospermum sp. JUN01]|nr:hypothetical protein [Dolichospermum sp. JUN01]
MSVVRCPLSVVSCQLSVVRCQLSVAAKKIIQLMSLFILICVYLRLSAFDYS